MWKLALSLLMLGIGANILEDPTLSSKEWVALFLIYVGGGIGKPVFDQIILWLKESLP